MSQRPNGSPAFPKRLALWEIEGSLQCSIIGTCLGDQDLLAARPWRASQLATRLAEAQQSGDELEARLRRSETAKLAALAERDAARAAAASQATLVQSTPSATRADLAKQDRALRRRTAAGSLRQQSRRPIANFRPCIAADAHPRSAHIRSPMMADDLTALRRSALTAVGRSDPDVECMALSRARRWYGLAIFFLFEDALTGRFDHQSQRCRRRRRGTLSVQGNGVAHAKCRGARIETFASSEVGWLEAKIASGAGSQPLWRRSGIDAPFIHSLPNL